MNAPPLPPNIVAVHPERMLTVTLQYPGYVVQVNAISCRYIPATVQVMQQVIQQQQRVVAIEVIRDPMNTHMSCTYCHDPNCNERPYYHLYTLT